jgi:hypothetical protein
MKWHDRLGWKIYFFVFAWTALGELLTLLSPDTASFIFYKVMEAFHPPYGCFYWISVASAALSLLAIFPLFRFSFRKPYADTLFWRNIFFLRLAGDLIGKKHTLIYMKSVLAVSPVTGVLLLLLSAAFLFPSYLIHFRCAFPNKETT